MLRHANEEAEAILFYEYYIIFLLVIFLFFRHGALLCVCLYAAKHVRGRLGE